jgi:hypothetical protein
MKQREPNHRLATVMERAGCSNKALARYVRREAESRGLSVQSDHVSVKRWLDGVRPQGQTPRLVADALARQLGEPVRLQDVGMAYAEDAPADISTALAIEPLASGLAAAGPLLVADLGGNAQLIRSAAQPAVWDSAIVHWLMPRAENETATAPTRPSRTDVRKVLVTTEAFSNLDFQFGGGHARSALIQYMSAEVAPLLPFVSSASEVGRQYLSAVSSMMALAGWMCYDTGSHGLSQQYLARALQCAKAAGDATLGGRVLADMSHQANYLGHSSRAANLARAACDTQGSIAPTARALFFAMKARALASLGRERECTQALMQAEAAFAGRDARDEPDWLGYFDEAELAAEFAHCFFALGHPTLALRSVEECSACCASLYVRSMTFVRSIQAASLVEQGHLEEGLHIARSVITTASDLRSVRPRRYVDDFLTQLQRWDTHPDVTEFRLFATDHIKAPTP